LADPSRGKGKRTTKRR